MPSAGNAALRKFAISQALEVYASLAARAKNLTDAAATAWLEDLVASGGRGVFFGACVYYAYVARRPMNNVRCPAREMARGARRPAAF